MLLQLNLIWVWRRGGSGVPVVGDPQLVQNKVAHHNSCHTPPSVSSSFMFRVRRTWFVKQIYFRIIFIWKKTLFILHDFLSPYFLVRFLGGWPLGTVIADLSKKSTVSSSSVSVVIVFGWHKVLLSFTVTFPKSIRLKCLFKTFISARVFDKPVPETDCLVRPLTPGRPPAGACIFPLLP